MAPLAISKQANATVRQENKVIAVILIVPTEHTVMSVTKRHTVSIHSRLTKKQGRVFVFRDTWDPIAKPNARSDFLEQAVRDDVTVETTLLGATSQRVNASASLDGLGNVARSAVGTQDVTDITVFKSAIVDLECLASLSTGVANVRPVNMESSVRCTVQLSSGVPIVTTPVVVPMNHFATLTTGPASVPRDITAIVARKRVMLGNMDLTAWELVTASNRTVKKVACVIKRQANVIANRVSQARHVKDHVSKDFGVSSALRNAHVKMEIYATM